MSHEKFQKAIALFDAANAEDPNTDVFEGVAHPKELLYARRMTACLETFAPDASEAVRLAARCQHIRRWAIPRSDYPMDRTGYRKWRTALQKYHAELAGELLREAGYSDSTIERVRTLVRKERLKRDPEVQLLEDVVCLVFLEHYFMDFAAKHDDEKLIGILRKTWAKMSPEGHRAALAMALPPAALRLVKKAIAE